MTFRPDTQMKKNVGVIFSYFSQRCQTEIKFEINIKKKLSEKGLFLGAP